MNRTASPRDAAELSSPRRNQVDAVDRILAVMDTMTPTQHAVRIAVLRQIGHLMPFSRSMCFHVVVREVDEACVDLALHRTFEIADIEDETDHSVQTFRAPADEPGLQLRPYATAMADFDIVCMFSPTAAAGALSPIVDEVIRLDTLTSEDVLDALEQRFTLLGGRDVSLSWPKDLSLTAIDVACGKAVGGADAVRMLQGFCGAAREGGSDTSEATSPLLGYGPAAEWAQSLADDLSAFQAGSIAWRDVDNGVLIVGASGTGKTRLASWIAASSRLPIVTTSYASWQRSGDGTLSGVLSAMTSAFEAAAAQAPCVLFVDDIDSAPTRHSPESSDPWCAAVRGALLAQLDGFAERTGVVLLAACTDPERLDPAIFRPGRFGRVVSLRHPDAEGLAQILAFYLDTPIEVADLSALTLPLAGSATGADMMRIAGNARRLARQDGRTLELSDVVAVALPTDTRSPRERMGIAVHEAGHVVALLDAGIVPSSVSVVPMSENGAGRTIVERLAAAVTTPLSLHRSLVQLLAGRAAEEAIIGVVSSGSGGSPTSDLATATRLAAAAEGQLGFGTTLLYDLSPDVRAIEIRLQRAYADALSLVGRRSEELMGLAQLLLRHRTLDGSQLRDFARQNRFPFAAEQASSPDITRGGGPEREP